MAINRCAACGSPRVMRDTQSGGYSYSKGFFGSLLFGSGGASAGVNGKKQIVYKCPDCGVTLSYSMSPDTLVKIERGLIDPTFPLLDWTALKAQYKNLEDGVIDRKIQKDNDNKTEAINEITSISKGEFIEIAKKISDYMKKCGYFKQNECIYDTTHLPPANEYLNVCKQAKLFINHMPQFMSLFDKKTSNFSPDYETLFSWVEVGRLMMFVMVLEYYEKNKRPMPINNKTAKDYFSRNIHLKDLALKCHVITDSRALCLSMGLKYDPNDISFENTISAASFPGDDLIEWLYSLFDEKESVECFYPQLIVKGNHIEVNHLSN